ncbi:hypothetical protein [Cellulomonas sp. ICMP 17802]|uniref:hypothetical protein n=1 Tax=Cellulomonas sp. ICMP 17802 TaxID=3239199 RepID=UPI00351ADB61
MSSRAVRATLVVVLVATLALLFWARHERQLEAGYEDAFAAGGVTAVVQLAQERGDAVEQFPGGVRAPYACYLEDGSSFPDLPLAQCREEAAVLVAARSGG